MATDSPFAVTTTTTAKSFPKGVKVCDALGN